MSKMLGYCLTLGNAEGWGNFSYVAVLRLSETERASLASSALNTLDPERAEAVAAASIGAAGAPLPTFLSTMEEARWWASCAAKAELKAYALAAFEAMAPTDRAAFFQHITGKEAAA